MRVANIDLKALPLADTLAWGTLAVIALIAAVTFADYGLGWDDFTHSQYGDLLLAYFGSGFTNTRAFRFVNLYYYGGGFDMAAGGLAQILPLDVFDARRMTGALVGLCGFFIVWRTGRRVAGPVGGLAALLLLAICPLFYGHIFMNAKDAPFAVAMAGLIYALVRAFDEFPKPKPFTVALIAVFLGLAVGTRILGFLAGVYGALALVFLLGVELRHMPARAAFGRSALFVGLIALGLPLAYFVMGIVWPWGVYRPENPIVALEYYSHFWEVPWREIFDGKAILVPDMPRSYVPTLFAVQMPEIFLGLTLGGAAGAILAAFLGTGPATRRAGLLLLVAAAFFPILLTVITRPVMYNGIRHFVFLTPPMAVLGGYAFAWIWGKVREANELVRVAVGGVFALGLALPIADFAEIHPYQYTYYNEMAGGVRGADKHFMLDYWGLAFKQATEELDEYVDEHAGQFPPHRPIKVAVCGPNRAAAAELGPRYEATYDTRNADFFLMLGQFYCAQPKAPVLVEVKREGVTYARVYDVRGRPFPSVFAAGQ